MGAEGSVRQVRWIAALAVVGLVAAACAPKATVAPQVTTKSVLIVGDSMAAQVACAIGVTTFDPGGTCLATKDGARGKWGGRPPPWPLIDGATGGCTISPEGTGPNKLTYSRPTLIDYNNSAYDPADPNKQLFTSCYDWPNKWTNLITKYNPKVVMLLIGGWEIVDRWFPAMDTQGHPGCLPPNPTNCPKPYSLADADPQHAAAAQTHFFAALNQAMHIFSKNGARVVLVQAPYLNPPVGQLVAGPGVPAGAVRIFYEPYLDNPSREAWNPDQINGVTPDQYDSKVEMNSLRDLENAWQASTTCPTPGCTPLNDFGGRPILDSRGLLNLHPYVDPTGAYTDLVCFTATPYAAVPDPGNPGQFKCDDADQAQGIFPTPTRVSDGVHLSLAALDWVVNHVIIPAIDDALADYS